MHSELLARLEAASADQQAGLLLEAWRAVWGSANCSVDACPEYRTFTRMVGLGAYESAALTLMPEGWSYEARQGPSGYPHIWDLLTIKSGDVRYTRVTGRAKSAALAIVIAAIRAKGDA